MTTETPTKLVISIPIQGDEDFVKSSPASPTEISALVGRLEKKTSFTPEALAKKEERAKALADIELDARRDRARRANERHQEGLARKLRLEAAAVARATEKITKKSLARTAKQEELDAKRVASIERQNALFESVREAREARQIEIARRQAALLEVEARAANSKAKYREQTVAKATAQVRHAATVAQAHKESAAESLRTAKANLSARLEAASDRRSEKLKQTVSMASEVVAAAEKTRLRKLTDDKASLEARRARLGQAMERALGRRSGAVETIQTKAAVSNARIKQRVEVLKEEAAAKPGQLAHALAVKMQAAEVNHGLALKQAQATALAAAAKYPPKPEAVIFIPADEATTGLRALPPPGLMERLLFAPKMLLATARARQLAAEGRRAGYRALIAARAAHLGTLRVARALGRRAALAEIERSLCALKTATAAQNAAAHLAAKKEKAKAWNARVTAAALRRSAARLALLNRAMAAEERRRRAVVTQAVLIQNRTSTAAAKARVNGFGKRREALALAKKQRALEFEMAASAVAERRALHLAGVVASAKRCMMRTAVFVRHEQVKSSEQPLAKLTVRRAIASAIVKNATADTTMRDESACASAISRAAAISDAAAAAAVAKASRKQAKASALKTVSASSKHASPKASPKKGKKAEGWTVVSDVVPNGNAVTPIA